MNLPVTCDVFVYGTLKPGEANYSSYCKAKVVSQISSYTLGNLYVLPMGYPAMTVGENRVYGVCLRFNDSRILASLDRLEDYQDGRSPDLNEYYRSLTPVYSLDDLLIGRAWAYFMTRDRVMQYGEVKVTSGCWSGRLSVEATEEIETDRKSSI